MNNHYSILGIMVATLSLYFFLVLALWGNSTVRGFVYQWEPLAQVFPATDGTTQDRYDIAWEQFNNRSRNLDSIERIVHPNVEHFHEPSVYLLIRVHLLRGQAHDAIAMADFYIEHFAENLQVYHLRGLAHAHLGYFNEAADDIARYVARSPDSWFGYLDLSWVYFQKGDMQQAQRVLGVALERFSQNPWLESAYSVVRLNQGENEQALYYAEQALQHIIDISVSEWQSIYFSRDIEMARKNIQDFSQVLLYNASLISNPQVFPSEGSSVFDISFVRHAPIGHMGGLHVSTFNPEQ